MRFFGSKNLEEQILSLLAENSYLEAKDLVDRTKGDRGPYSLQAVYKGLSKLIEAGAIIKAKTKYSLHLSWVCDYLAMGEKLKDCHIRN